MVDVHSHILAGIDDGAKNDDESLKMLKVAISQGIKTIIATPHHNEFWPNEKEDILVLTNHLKQLAKEKNLDIEILPGQEVRIEKNFLKNYEKGLYMTLGNETTRYILTELPFQLVPRYAEQVIEDIVGAGLVPVIPHPERTDELMRDYSRLADMVQMGARVQLTAGSLTGAFGNESQRVSQMLIEDNLAHLIATDAHRTTGRIFDLVEAYAEIERLYGAEKMAYFKENAEKLVRNEVI